MESKDNKYLKWYWNICDNAKDRILESNIYTEGHHIYPKSIYGENKYLVKLTAKEHYIVHLVLWWGLRAKYGTKDKRTISMANAFNCMCRIGKGQQRVKIDSLRYEMFKLANLQSKQAYYSDQNNRLNASIKNKKFWAKEENRLNQSILIKSKISNNDDYSKKRSDISKEYFSNYQNRLKTSEATKKAMDNDIVRKKLSERNKKMWANEEYRLKQKERVSKQSKEFWAKEENRLNASIKNKEFWGKEENQKYKKYKPIIQLDENDNIINEYKSAKYASEDLNISLGSIYNCCNGRSKTAGGSKWRYKNEGDIC